MEKRLSLLAVVVAAGLLCACGSNSGSDESSIKVGLITLHGTTSTYDKNFIDAFNAAAKKKGVKPIIYTNVGEDNGCYDKAALLADQHCKFVFANSFGHEDYIIKAAKEFTNVQFSHATGTKAHIENIPNYHNAFASIYEGRYLAGVAAGMKLQAMLDAGKATGKTTSKKIGYVGAYTYAEVISGYTSFFLGVRSIVSDATMEVTFTGSWYDEALEKAAAEKLIADGCSLLSQHADSWGAPTACESAGVPDVTYNGSTESRCPNTYVISSRINWEPYFEYCFDAIKNGTEISTDYTGALGDTLYNGSVALSEPGKKGAAQGTEAKLNEVATALRNGTVQVFDTSKFTVTGENFNPATTMKVDAEGHLTSYMANISTEATEAIETKGGITYFAESSKRSAPYFDVHIDDITLLNTKFE